MISGVVLARNEEANIVACLVALRPFVSEIILIDMESSDRTVELASPLVDKVVPHPLVEHFDAARNVAIDQVAHDWLWFVDADERISQATGRTIIELVRTRGDQFEAITIPFKSYFCGQWMQHCGWWPGYTMPRVMKRGHFHFRERVHGGVQVNGRQVFLPPDPSVGVDHYSYRTIEHYIEKFNRYTSTEARQLDEAGSRWDWRRGMRHMVQDLWQYYELNQGSLDRERGWVLSWLSGQYRWLSHAKLLDLSGPSPDATTPADVPASLDDVFDLARAELDRLRAGTPQLPLGIIWRSPVWDPSGYAEESRVFVRGLAAGRRPLRLEEIHWSDKTCDLTPATKSLLSALTRAERPKYAVKITNCIATLVEPDPRASLNVLRTTFETDRIPANWHERLSKFDEIWVISEHNRLAFRQSGVAPEKIRVVPSCVDTGVYTPQGDVWEFPEALRGRFAFLSVFDWQLRKGWDVLLRAYCRCFGPTDSTALILKITRSHGHSLELIRKQANAVLSGIGQSLEMRPDIVLWDFEVSEPRMAALYRSVQAFVLPSRGEGWGRPYMEAMATGLPTIATGASGNIDFMSTDNSLLISAKRVEVPESAVAEIPVYAGQRWFEPDEDELVSALRTIHTDPARRDQVATRALEDIRSRFCLEAGTRALEDALSAAEEKFSSVPCPVPRADQVRVSLEGEFFALHSFSIVNEQLVTAFEQTESIAIGAARVRNQPTFDHEVPHAHRLKPALSRRFEQGPQVTIRHAFPPNWQPPAVGRWVHIQPWEFGHLPKRWIEPLADLVDEVWAPSSYVRDVYVRSGIPAGKVHVVPWGIDPEVFRPDAPPVFLPTRKTFRFLFVGGTIPRKGIDFLLDAYLSEFTPDDDVCLVVKDMGTQSFYRDCHYRDEIVRAANNPHNPEIIYLDGRVTAGQLASLYTSCHCLVAPYRGEGFGLPILEAMACGLVPIVPRHGPSDDFTTDETAIRLPSRTVETKHDWDLCGPATELAVSVADVRAAMRNAFTDRESLARRRVEASVAVRTNWTWSATVARMSERIAELAAREAALSPPAPRQRQTAQTASSTITAYFTVFNDELILAETLARVAPFVDQMVVELRAHGDRSRQIAHEYGAHIALDGAAGFTSEWIVCVHPGERLSETAMSNLRATLGALSKETSAVAVQRRPNGAQSSTPELRIFRNRDGLGPALKTGNALAQFLTQDGGKQAAIDLVIS